MVDLSHFATASVVNQQLIGGYLLIQHHSLRFPCISKRIQKHIALQVYVANLVSQKGFKCVGLFFIGAGGFIIDSLRHEDGVKQLFQ